jgi:hypothetical protein
MRTQLTASEYEDDIELNDLILQASTNVSTTLLARAAQIRFAAEIQKFPEVVAHVLNDTLTEDDKHLLAYLATNTHPMPWLPPAVRVVVIQNALFIVCQRKSLSLN